jgi:P4 family phage/plasmid primase-like protien
LIPWTPYQRQQPTEVELYQWQEKYHPSVYGLTTGGTFIVLDPDTPEWMQLLTDAGLKPHIKTPRGLGHFYVWAPRWRVVTRAPIRGLIGIDVRGEGGFVNFAGSIDGSGSYEVLEWPTLDKLIPFTSLPVIIQRALEPQPEPITPKDRGRFPPLSAEDCQKCADKLETLPCIVYCKANAADLPETQWWQMVTQFVSFGLPGETKIHQLSHGYEKHRGYTERETQKKIEDTKKARGRKDLGPHLCQTIRDSGDGCSPECLALTEKLGVSTPATLAIKLTLAHDRLPLNDVGNANRLVRLFGDDIRFVLDMEKWLVWNGKYWQFDHGEQLGRLAKKVVLSIYGEAAQEEDATNRDKLATWAKQSGYELRIKGLISQARWSEGITVMPSELDADPWLLNVANGTVNFLTGELQPHQREDLITRIIPINYNPDAASPLWEDTLKQIFSDNSDLVCYIRRALGYSATGSTQEMAAFFPQGAGFNGKSTLLGSIVDVLGPYAAQVDPAVFMLSKTEHPGPSEPMADLYRVRFALCAEIEAGMRLSVGLVKRVTGGEELRHERKYEHGFNFKPEFKLWLMSNHEPIISDSTNSIWGRIKKIPFSHSFSPEERIPNLRQRLVTEHGEALLAWLVFGALEWREFGLSEPAIISRATQEYCESQDVLHDFLRERCTQEATASVLVSELYNAYLAWCESNGEKRPLGKINFGKALKERGFGTKPGTDNKTLWRGIKVL